MTLLFDIAGWLCVFIAGMLIPQVVRLKGNYFWIWVFLAMNAAFAVMHEPSWAILMAQWVIIIINFKR